jgi:hypothetical protein
MTKTPHIARNPARGAYMSGMRGRPTVLERAFELARTGSCRGISEIKTRLIREGYEDAAMQLYGPSLRKQLTALCVEARSKAL